MSKLYFTIGDKEISLTKSLVKTQFKWLSTLFGIDTEFEEKNQLIYDILDYLPQKCDLEVISIIKEVNEWVYNRKKYNEVNNSHNGRQAINFLKYGPSKLENIKKWQCTKCLKISYEKNEEIIKHELQFFGSNDCAAICVNCGIRWSSWYNPVDNNVIYCKKIQKVGCQHNWEEI